MAIWFKPVSVELCKKLEDGMTGKGTLMKTLGIEISEVGDDYLVATMPAIPEHHNPMGMVHGGANVALAETVASYAANFVVDTEQFYCVGQEINANHLKASRTGMLTAIAKPVHLGKRSSVWEIRITNSRNELCCISRMTAAVVSR
ncbi:MULTISPECIES: hotdog fold thioesterase [Pseudoalteromonas]|uniref:hotdog fold thioesterase n=1 Tax=Pseudoalteromonas TaxID=53246 RepID=UPI00029B2F2B|nr:MULTISPECIES: hotdog fold thioesterase [Pseudoalteromonas]AUJ68629.1 Esterase YdiI [Pseudoalteromonas sp. NC201]MBR8842957.1 hotdog fold thioesterase [Pseudoalteromonas sp. JC3]MCF2828812.1 hotdog fold thioesterase [Pseudoalteromonas sp. OF5H-5]MCF2831089.1 hotdog fold thioesterase [Pseudoalteromonas sp. DL2-H6]MCF2925732.1 hotdog fold thioesterase [Pseudoalteromonas sp. DL2-H1]